MTRVYCACIAGLVAVLMSCGGTRDKAQERATNVNEPPEEARCVVPPDAGPGYTCKPPPNVQGDPTDEPRVDFGKLGGECQGGYVNTCKGDEQCWEVPGGQLRCAVEPCDAITCPAGTRCGHRPS